MSCHDGLGLGAQKQYSQKTWTRTFETQAPHTLFLFVCYLFQDFAQWQVKLKSEREMSKQAAGGLWREPRPMCQGSEGSKVEEVI